MGSRPTDDFRAQLDLEERYQPLLKDILIHAHRSRETPLRFGIDSDGIINSALRSFFLAQNARTAEDSPDWQSVQAVFDALVQRALADQREPQSGLCRSRFDKLPNSSNGRPVSPAAAGSANNKNAPHPLAVWLEHFHAVLRGVHPQAIEIVRLRMDASTNRDVAQQLGLGLYLVKRIIEDLRRTLGTEARP